MAQTTDVIVFSKGLFANLPSTRDANTLYFCTDTHQIFLGDNEYTKGTKILSATPTESTEGDIGRLYAYNGNLYLCSAVSGSTYTWIRVANVNDIAGTVTSISAGDGLETADGQDITVSGTIKHSIPTGSTAVSNPVAGPSTLAFGSTFAVQGVSTDKFGHVTGSTATTFTMPTETALTVEDETGTPETLAAGSTFAVVTGVEEGVADQAVKQTTTVFTLPADENTTYSFATSTSTDGAITVTPSEGSAYDVVIKGFDDLAKKTDITAVFKFKGTVADVASLPTTGDVGDVYHVTAANAEYVCIQASTTDPAADAVWEELGTDIDLSAYALADDVIPKVASATAGNVANLKADGTIEDSGFTLGCSVPSTAVFTDTTYSPVSASTAADPGLMTGADKVKLDGIQTGAQVNVLEGIKVGGTTLAIDADKCVDLTTTLSWQTF